jgi:hypothetical protein
VLGYLQETQFASSVVRISGIQVKTIYASIPVFKPKVFFRFTASRFEASSFLSFN